MLLQSTAFSCLHLFALVVAAEEGKAPPVVLSDTTSRSAVMCQRNKGGCEFTVRRSRNHWHVIVKPIVRSASGEQLDIPGVNANFFYNLDGSFSHEMPDL